MSELLRQSVDLQRLAQSSSANLETPMQGYSVGSKPSLASQGAPPWARDLPIVERAPGPKPVATVAARMCGESAIALVTGVPVPAALSMIGPLLAGNPALASAFICSFYTAVQLLVQRREADLRAELDELRASTITHKKAK